MSNERRFRDEHADPAPTPRPQPAVGHGTLTQRFVARPSSEQRAREHALLDAAWATPLEGHVQRDARGPTDADVAAAAARGIAGPGGALPHLEAVQRSFGAHDLGGVVAHVGGAAAQACDDMNAHGFATGNHVAFADTPSLFLAAHEAAHVVQQRAGVQLSSGVGSAGDVYEQQADAVAARVVRGESAVDLLPPVAGVGAGAVQLKARYEDPPSAKHDERERWGGDDQVHEHVEVRDFRSRITMHMVEGQLTRIGMGGGYKHHIFVGYEGVVLDKDGDVLCEFTIDKVTENRAQALVPLHIQELQGVDTVVIRPSSKPAPARLKKPTEARIIKIFPEGDDYWELTIAIGDRQGVRVGTRGYLEKGGRRHAFVVERAHFRPDRTTLLVPRAGTHAAQEHGEGFTFENIAGSVAVFLP